MLIVAGQAAVEGTPFGCSRLVRLLGRGGTGEACRSSYDTDVTEFRDPYYVKPNIRTARR